jgi:plasmid replication initiation protein
MGIVMSKGLKEKKGIAFSNSLICGKYSLTKEEQNLIYLVASQIHKDDKEFHRYKVHLSDLDKATGTKHNRQKIKELMNSIMSKPIWLNQEQTEISNWFSYIKSVEKENALMCEFHWSLKSHLLDLQGLFTKAELTTLFTFKSKYTSRLYMLLKSIYDLETCKIPKTRVCTVFEVDYLISSFSMPKSYAQRYSAFKENFLISSINEINEHTNFNISYDDKSTHRKSGRKITSIEFCISEKEKSQEQLKKEIENTKTLSDYMPKNISSKAISVLLDKELGLKNHDLKHIFDHYKSSDIENICEDLWKCWDSPKIISKQGLLRGKIKKLDKKKTENLSFFDEI